LDSTLILPLLALAVAVGALYVAARRAVTIAELDIERGIIRVVRGGIAPRIRADPREVGRRPPIGGRQVRALR